MYLNKFKKMYFMNVQHPQMSAPTPQKRIPTPQKKFEPPRLREYSHEKEVLWVSQSINSTDFLQKNWGFAPNLL